jgi:hypothetical protein
MGKHRQHSEQYRRRGAQWLSTAGEDLDVIEEHCPDANAVSIG